MWLIRAIKIKTVTKKTLCVCGEQGWFEKSMQLASLPPLHCRFSQELSSIVGASATVSQMFLFPYSVKTFSQSIINTSNCELNPICHLLALLGAHHILRVSRVRVNLKRNGQKKPETYGRVEMGSAHSNPRY
jgi:hypothetical protein